MGLFQFLFGRKKDIENWDKDLESPEAAGEHNTEPVAAPSEMPAPATDSSELSEEIKAVLASIDNSVSASMTEEQAKKTVPMRVTPVPVSRRSAPHTENIPEQSEPAAEQPELPDIPISADPEPISDACCAEIAEISESIPEEAVIPKPDDVADHPPEETSDAELSIPAVAEEPDFPVQPDISSEPVQPAAPAQSPVEPPEAVQDSPEKSVPLLERDAQMKKSGKKSSHDKRSNAEQRIVLRLRGTTKPHCIKALENCFTGQHVFISYDSKRARCFVYTEEGEEIGRLSRSDSKKFAEEYDARIHSTYITKIKKDDERFRVKLLLLIAAQQPFITEQTRF